MKTKTTYQDRGSSAQLAERLISNGSDRLRATFGYDARNQLRSIANQRGTASISSHVYRASDKMGRREIVDRKDGTQWQYDYNSKGEVAKAGKYRRSSEPLAEYEPLAGYQFRFLYDAGGNRAEKSWGGNDEEGIGLVSNTYSTTVLDDIADQYKYFLTDIRERRSSLHGLA